MLGVKKDPPTLVTDRSNEPTKLCKGGVDHTKVAKISLKTLPVKSAATLTRADRGPSQPRRNDENRKNKAGASSTAGFPKSLQLSATESSDGGERSA